jgi:outer membrane protein
MDHFPVVKTYFYLYPSLKESFDYLSTFFEMHNMRSFILLAIFLVVSNLTFGQKFGHVNSALIVQNHPGIATANAELDAFRKTVTEPFDAKTKAFQTKYQFYMEEMEAGTLSKVTAQTRQAELAKEQDDLNKEGQQLQYTILQKRDLVLQPILAQVDSMISVIGKEGKYTMIFDDSINGALLFSNPTDDLTDQVKAKCGIK